MFDYCVIGFLSKIFQSFFVSFIKVRLSILEKQSRQSAEKIIFR